MSGLASRLRWHIKKAARLGMALGSYPVYAMTPQRTLEQGLPVRVLTYHRFGTLPRDPFCVSPALFEQQMAYLAQSGRAISLADFESYLAGRKLRSPAAILVTVDDGYRSLYTEALPILRHYRIPAVAFVTPSYIGPAPAHSIAAPAIEPYLTWRELTELADAGVAIASHAWTHRSMGRLAPADAEQEAVRSRNLLEQRLQRPATAFAYPFGTRADFNPVTARILRAAGYTCAFTSQHGSIRPGVDPYALPRIKVEGGEAAWLFRLLTRGGMDGWRWIDRTLWGLQASGYDT
jgi:peptidoglycan/xylan/chitin deacetylase (PgdA/CDA1 family)